MKFHSYGPLKVPQKDHWVIIGSGPSATQEAIQSIPKSYGVISLNSILPFVDHPDVHFISHYEDFTITLPYWKEGMVVFIANPLHVGYRCSLGTVYQLLDVEYFSRHSELDIRFFEKDPVLKSALLRSHTLFNHHTIATAALHLLSRNHVERVETLGIDGGDLHSKAFSGVYYYDIDFPMNYDQAYREFCETAIQLGMDVKKLKETTHEPVLQTC